MARHNCQSLRPRRAATSVEFAMVAPVLFLVIFGTIEVGRALMAQHALEEAVRVGCRLAILNDALTSEIHTAVIEELAVAGITANANMIDVSPDPPTNACLWDAVSVSATISYFDLSWLPVPAYMNNVNLSASCTLPREGNSCN